MVFFEDTSIEILIGSVVTPESTVYSKLRILNDSLVKLLGFVLDPEMTWNAAS